MNKAKRKAIIAGNWKMNNTPAQTTALINEMKPLVADADCEVVLCVPFVDIPAAVEAVKQLSTDVGIPADLKDIVKPEDVDFLSQSAYDDACRPGNPRETSVEEIKQLYLSLM